MGWIRAKSSVRALPMAFSRSQTHADFIGAITPTRVRVARLRTRAVPLPVLDRLVDSLLDGAVRIPFPAGHVPSRAWFQCSQ